MDIFGRRAGLSRRGARPDVIIQFLFRRRIRTVIPSGSTGKHRADVVVIARVRFSVSRIRRRIGWRRAVVVRHVETEGADILRIRTVGDHRARRDVGDRVEIAVTADIDRQITGLARQTHFVVAVAAAVPSQIAPTVRIVLTERLLVAERARISCEPVERVLSFVNGCANRFEKRNHRAVPAVTIVLHTRIMLAEIGRIRKAVQTGNPCKTLQ